MTLCCFTCVGTACTFGEYFIRLESVHLRNFDLLVSEAGTTRCSNTNACNHDVNTVEDAQEETCIIPEMTGHGA